MILLFYVRSITLYITIIVESIIIIVYFLCIIINWKCRHSSSRKRVQLSVEDTTIQEEVKNVLAFDSELFIACIQEWQQKVEIIGNNLPNFISEVN